MRRYKPLGVFVLGLLVGAYLGMMAGTYMLDTKEESLQVYRSVAALDPIRSIVITVNGGAHEFTAVEWFDVSPGITQHVMRLPRRLTFDTVTGKNFPLDEETIKLNFNYAKTPPAPGGMR